MEAEAAKPRGLCALPVELVGQIGRFLRPGDGTLHQACYALSPLATHERHAAHERGLADILSLALASKWLYAALRPVYWEHPIQPANLDVHALKRLNAIKPSVLPYIQSLDMRDGMPANDALRARTDPHAPRRAPRFDAIIVLSRMGKQMPALRSLAVNSISHLPINWNFWPALRHLSLTFASFPNSNAVAALLVHLPQLKSLEFGAPYSNRKTPREDKEDNFANELRVFGKPLPQLRANDWSIKPPLSRDERLEMAQDGTLMPEDDDIPADGFLPPGSCTLFTSLQELKELEHLILTSAEYLQPARWPVDWISPPNLRSLTLTLTCTFSMLETLLQRFSPTIEKLQLCISGRNDASWWSAYDSGLTLPSCDKLVELEMAQYGGMRVIGPTLRLFRGQLALRHVRILYRSGQVKRESGLDVEDAPDLEELQQLAIECDALPGLRRLVVRNLKAFRFDFQYDGLFDLHVDVKQDEIGEVLEQALEQEGWPKVRARKALAGGRDLEQARQWLIDNLETPGIDDEAMDGQTDDEGNDDDDEESSEPDDAQVAREVEANERTQAAKEAHDFAKTINIVEQLRILFATREPPVEFLCWPEGREPDECD